MRGPVLFVCRRNHCRSPMAEGAFRLAARRAGLQIECDSAGIAPEREGEAPDWRAQMVAGRHGANISGQRSRRVVADDFGRFGLILAMDRHNLDVLQRITPVGGGAHIALFMYMIKGGHGKSLRDPYCGNVGDFADCWIKIWRGVRDLIG
ncbi:low molecular weight protein-tyrosine-phosphatase [Novosphingobium humi]|uniref:low molecular weight protein-tyrosine-phosphatase n=1 Tax=Novosphingobium humi TaxID=2282397 RepID=UPI0025B1451F|nr:low molecular weight protein-tyrosine-phosphatase [Novosphingobium humi]WJS97822.1 low molecular weight phosphotyrosine protein phosphatase [Novosphingobium humi]